MNSKDMQNYQKKGMDFTRRRIKESITPDIYIVQLISHIGELDKVFSILVKRLRDWYELYLPEVSNIIRDHDKFVKVIRKDKRELMKSFGITESMGQDFTKDQVKAIIRLCDEIDNIRKLQSEQLSILEIIMEKNFPNLSTLAGYEIGAKLIDIAGNLKNLMEFPASTIQILGAEKALFRHLKTGSRPPKYGILLAHPYVAESENKSKAARRLADKISIAVKVDYFKGEYVADKLLRQLK